ncbi:hypothetical protein [Streptomyces sp. NPDC048357]|uniref:hypothetical protein n=1 Tax=Streptomyces sp. NPDC048357 TaxID=3154719 RepID=UPI00342B569C
MVAAVFSGGLGIAIPVLAASLAVTFALVGLGHRMSRIQCVTGLVTGSLGVAWPVFPVAAFGD